MVSILLIFGVIFLLVLIFLTDSFIFAAVITAIIVSVFFTVNLETETIVTKYDDKISIIINNTISKIDTASKKPNTVFSEESETVMKEDLKKLPINHYDYPSAQYLDISRRSSTTASFYSSGSYITACLNDKTEICFKDNYLKTHSDGTKFICETNSKTCYRAK